ncbi:MAG: MBL fold metallo-hydrolase [Desulfobacterales bacterium]|nr:MBL fold metallo-hydrolase [Desulfobacterales bacterium]
MTHIHRIEVPIPFPLKTVNCYYIPDSTPTLIDTGVNGPEGLDVIAAGIRSTGGRLSDLKRVILTHGHTDHVGLAGKIASHSRAAVFIHLWDRDKIPVQGENWLESRHDILHGFLTESGLPGEIGRQILELISGRFKRLIGPVESVSPFNGQAVFDFDDMQLGVVHTPGHSPGSICLFNRDNGTLLAGDSLLEKITPNPVVEISPPAEDPEYQSLARYEATLEMISGLAVRAVLPGHGPSFKDHAGVVRHIQRHHRVRRNRVLNLLKTEGGLTQNDGGLTPYRVALRLFPDIRGVDIFLALSEAMGHLDYLRVKGAADMQFYEGSRVYRFSSKGVKS